MKRHSGDWGWVSMESKEHKLSELRLNEAKSIRVELIDIFPMGVHERIIVDGDVFVTSKPFMNKHESIAWARELGVFEKVVFCLVGKYHKNDGVDPDLHASEVILASRRYTKPGSVYFVLDSTLGLVKVGWSLHPEQRVRVVRRSRENKVLFTIPGGPDIESMIHEALRAYRWQGEWFVFSESTRDIIDRLQHEARDMICPTH